MVLLAVISYESNGMFLSVVTQYGSNAVFLFGVVSSQQVRNERDRAVGA